MKSINKYISILEHIGYKKPPKCLNVFKFEYNYISFNFNEFTYFELCQRGVKKISSRKTIKDINIIDFLIKLHPEKMRKWKIEKLKSKGEL